MLLWTEGERCLIPYRVDHRVEMDGSRVTAYQGCWHLDGDNLVGVHGGGHCEVGLQRSGRVDGVVFLILLFLLFLFLLPFLYLLGQVLLAFFVGYLCQHLHG